MWAWEWVKWAGGAPENDWERAWAKLDIKMAGSEWGRKFIILYWTKDHKCACFRSEWENNWWVHVLLVLLVCMCIWKCFDLLYEVFVAFVCVCENVFSAPPTWDLAGACVYWNVLSLQYDAQMEAQAHGAGYISQDFISCLHQQQTTRLWKCALHLCFL